jgi:hypothetical protein
MIIHNQGIYTSVSTNRVTGEYDGMGFGKQLSTDLENPDHISSAKQELFDNNPSVWYSCP